MQLKKLLQGSAFALVAAACAIAAPSVAKAAAGDGQLGTAGISSVDVDGTKGEMTITAASGKKEVLVGIGKVNAKKGTISVPTWDSYDLGTGTTAKVDLSKLSNVKDNYIVVSTPNSEVSIIKFPAVDKVIKTKFNAGTGELQIGKGANAGAAAPASLTLADSGQDKATVSLYEYRTAYGNWDGLENKVAGTGATAKLDLSLYQEEGAKLFIRTKGGKTSTALTGAQNGKEEYTYGTSTTKIKVYDAPSLPGKEAKVTIPAKAKGPKAVADYVNGKIKFPKGSEYRLASADKLQTLSASLTKYPAGGVKSTLTEVRTAGGTDFASATSFDVEVRTAATDKKAASKWSRLSVTMPTKLSATGAAYLKTKGSDQEKKNNGALPAQPEKGQPDATGGDKGIKSSVLLEDLTKSETILPVKYVTKGKLDASKYYTANAIEIENKGTKKYEIATTAKDAQSVAADVKATKIAPGKKVVLTKVDDGAKVWIRVAGDKKTTTWVGDFDDLGVVDYPYTVPAKTE